MDNSGNGGLSDKADLDKNDILSKGQDSALGQDAAAQRPEVYGKPEAEENISLGFEEKKEKTGLDIEAFGQEEEKDMDGLPDDSQAQNPGMMQGDGQGNQGKAEETVDYVQGSGRQAAGMPLNGVPGNSRQNESMPPYHNQEIPGQNGDAPLYHNQGIPGQNGDALRYHNQGSPGQNGGTPTYYGQENRGQNSGMPPYDGQGNRRQNVGTPPYNGQGSQGKYVGMPSNRSQGRQGQNMFPESGYNYGGQGRNPNDAIGRMPDPGRAGYYNGQNSYQYPEQGGYEQEMEVPLTVGEWLISMLLMLIPCVNIILMFVWAFGDKEKRSKSNYYKARLIFCGILIGILFLWTCFYGIISVFL